MGKSIILSSQRKAYFAVSHSAALFLGLKIEIEITQLNN